MRFGKLTWQAFHLTSLSFPQVFLCFFFFFFYAICCAQGNTPSSYPMSWSQDLLEFLILAYTFLWNL